MEAGAAIARVNGQVNAWMQACTAAGLSSMPQAYSSARAVSQLCCMAGNVAQRLCSSVVEGGLGAALSSGDAYRVASSTIISLDAAPAVNSRLWQHHSSLPRDQQMAAPDIEEVLPRVAGQTADTLCYLLEWGAQERLPSQPPLHPVARQLRRTTARPANVAGAMQNLSWLLLEAAGGVEGVQGGCRLQHAASLALRRPRRPYLLLVAHGTWLMTHCFFVSCLPTAQCSCRTRHSGKPSQCLVSAAESCRLHCRC